MRAGRKVPQQQAQRRGHSRHSPHPGPTRPAPEASQGVKAVHVGVLAAHQEGGAIWVRGHGGKGKESFSQHTFFF